MAILWSNTKKSITALFLSVFVAHGSQAAGLMTPADGSLPKLQIKQHHVDVVIEDGYAITTIDQVFHNPNSQTLEANYSFPVPEKASVGEFTYWIEGKPVTGEVLEQEKARDVYEQEKAQGRETAITEKDEYRTFNSSVYPVKPQDDVRIRLVYIQPVHVDLGVGRYVYPLEEGGVDEQTLAFWTYNKTVEEGFSFNLRMRSSYPIDDFRLPQHPDAIVNQQSGQVWEVSLAKGQVEAALEGAATSTQASPRFTLDKDIVVYWRHQPGLPGSIDMVAHKSAGSDRGTFMMTLTPGDDLAGIQGGRDWVFCTRPFRIHAGQVPEPGGRR